ncbi:HNH endonuclease [Paenibacillus brevis]|uniref:HNH endonuclease n=1 Tax=Paenibacillus brevis TaxID=2841508 RepID=A0ABS6FPN6_9BACL|nr:HNH endonuclease [Paenibacillus brevis]MBU5672192.1 HNH endonuclease [Paenibacillus brevis]
MDESLCIICGTVKKGTEEHIIPKSLGNESLKIYCVCKECNSGLGANVDSYLVNHMFTQIIRQSLGLKGQSGEVPNPFKKGYDREGNIVHVNGDFVPRTLPRLEQVGTKVRITAPSRELALTMLRKKLSRQGFSDVQIEQYIERENIIREENVHHPEIRYDMTVDLNKFYLSALKIAYEYGYHKLGKLFYNDETAQYIRMILFNASNGNFDYTYEKVRLLPSFMTHIIEKAQGVNCHMLFLHQDTANQLIVDVILFMTPVLSFSVCISNNALKYRIGNEFITEIVPIQ